MDDYLKEALEIVKAQASVRNMTEEEITSMVRNLAAGIQTVAGAQDCPCIDAIKSPVIDAAKAIKETSITCLECGKAFKVLTKKHLAHHALTPDEYWAKHGYKKTQALACKSLVRERRKKMKDMRLWERRQKSDGAA